MLLVQQALLTVNLASDNWSWSTMIFLMRKIISDWPPKDAKCLTSFPFEKSLLESMYWAHCTSNSSSAQTLLLTGLFTFSKWKCPINRQQENLCDLCNCFSKFAKFLFTNTKKAIAAPKRLHPNQFITSCDHLQSIITKQCEVNIVQLKLLSEPP